MVNSAIAQLIQIVGTLPENKVAQVLDFARFLLWQEEKRPGEPTPFDVWAERLAQEKGFAYMTEQDVARIVRESRQATE